MFMKHWNVYLGLILIISLSLVQSNDIPIISEGANLSSASSLGEQQSGNASVNGENQ